MRCPKCGHPMQVTNTYKGGDAGIARRLLCSNGKCGTVATTQTILVNIDPGYGEGAAALAKKMATKRPATRE